MAAVVRSWDEQRSRRGPGMGLAETGLVGAGLVGAGMPGAGPVGAGLGDVLDRARVDHAAGRLREAAEGYGRALKLDGRSVVGLLGLSLVARQSGQKEAALRMAEAALGGARDAEGALLALAHVGHCLAGLGRLAEAEEAFRRVLEGGERRGGRALEEGRFCGSACRRISGLAKCRWRGDGCGRQWGSFGGWWRGSRGWRQGTLAWGNALGLEEEWTGALGCFEKVCELLPSGAEGYFGVAYCKGKLGDPEEAIEGYRRAVERRPGFAGAWLNLGVSLVAEGRDGLGEACYREVLGMTGGKDRRGGEAGSGRVQTRISALLNLGHLERGRKRFAEAMRWYGEALDLDSENGSERTAEIQGAFCSWHLEQGQFPQAWRALRVAERGKAEDAEAANVRGILLLGEDSASVGSVSVKAQFGAADDVCLVNEAVSAFGEAERRGHRTAASNRGNALLRLGRCEEALRTHELAVRLNPMHAGARYNLALTQLRMGDFRWGWMNYEARWAFREVHARPRRFRQPRWEGEAGGTVLVCAEQGLGDTVQFARFLPAVAARLTAGGTAAGLVVEVQQALVRLMEPLVGGLEGRFGGLRARVVGAGDGLPDFTAHCPLMSLPAMLGTEVGTVPKEVPYLGVGLDGETRRDGRLVVGMAWAGNSKYKADGERSTRLETFLPLLRVPGVRWVSLQKGAEAEIAAVRARWECEVEDGCSRDRDLADAAAVVAGLDLVITTDTVMAHLAGAMGKRVWILLAWQADWRWMQERETTPWYSTARLFRQARRGDWAGLVERVRMELDGLLCAEKIGGVGL